METDSRSTLPAELSVDTGTLAGTRFILDRPLITIGRAAENDIVLEDEMASKHHCRIVTQGDNYLVEDLGSSNGTIVNGKQVNSRLLSDGDKLYLGETTLTFRKGQPAAVAGAVKAAGGRRKGIWIAVGVLGGLVLITGLVLVLVLVVLPENDVMRPDVKINSPADNLVVELNLPVNSAKEVEFSVTASDDKGLDKVEIIANSDVLTTLKATKATKESKAAGRIKEEEFSYIWKVNVTQDTTFRAKAYDWKGNTADSFPVVIHVKEGADIHACRNYVNQIEPLINEYVQLKGRFNRTYRELEGGKKKWDDGVAEFYDIRSRRESLLSKLDAITPPPVFAMAHSLFKTAVEYAKKADEFAILWTADVATWDEFYGDDPYNPLNPPLDPMKYEEQMLEASKQAQGAESQFNREYDRVRAEQLAAGPGSHL